MSKRQESCEDKGEEPKDEDSDESKYEFCTPKELEVIDNKSMAFKAKKFGNMRFKKHKDFKSKPSFGSSSKDKTSKSSFNGGYKTGYH